MPPAAAADRQHSTHSSWGGLMVATRPVRAAAKQAKEPGGMTLHAIEKRKVSNAAVLV